MAPPAELSNAEMAWWVGVVVSGSESLSLMREEWGRLRVVEDRETVMVVDFGGCALDGAREMEMGFEVGKEVDWGRMPSRGLAEGMVSGMKNRDRRISRV